MDLSTGNWSDIAAGLFLERWRYCLSLADFLSRTLMYRSPALYTGKFTLLPRGYVHYVPLSLSLLFIHLSKSLAHSYLSGSNEHIRMFRECGIKRTKHDAVETECKPRWSRNTAACKMEYVPQCSLKGMLSISLLLALLCDSVLGRAIYTPPSTSNTQGTDETITPLNAADIRALWGRRWNLSSCFPGIQIRIGGKMINKNSFYCTKSDAVSCAKVILFIYFDWCFVSYSRIFSS